MTEQEMITLKAKRIGDFYEFFGDAALTVAKVLELVVTSTRKKPNVPMCGVPVHSSERYFADLAAQGFQVEIEARA